VFGSRHASLTVRCNDQFKHDGMTVLCRSKLTHGARYRRRLVMRESIMWLARAAEPLPSEPKVDEAFPRRSIRKNHFSSTRHMRKENKRDEVLNDVRIDGCYSLVVVVVVVVVVKPVKIAKVSRTLLQVTLCTMNSSFARYDLRIGTFYDFRRLICQSPPPNGRRGWSQLSPLC
jgi:hypothetical protein